MNSAFKLNLEKRKIGKGFSIFSKADLPKDTIILEFHGPIITDNVFPVSLPDRYHYLQIDREIFIGPSGDVDDYISHSCNPNCGVSIVGHRAFLKSIMQIKRGTEITFDYATTANDDKEAWQMECSCGDFNCRKIVSGFQYLDDKTQERYMALGIVPSYLMERK
jgi:hypothetical protein